MEMDGHTGVRWDMTHYIHFQKWRLEYISQQKSKTNIESKSLSLLIALCYSLSLKCPPPKIMCLNSWFISVLTHLPNCSRNHQLNALSEYEYWSGSPTLLVERDNCLYLFYPSFFPVNSFYLTCFDMFFFWLMSYFLVRMPPKGTSATSDGSMSVHHNSCLQMRRWSSEHIVIYIL